MTDALLMKPAPFVAAFLGALVLTLVLTPLVREMNRRLGMVDAPGARRVNKTPSPRGGGLALILGVLVSYSLLIAVTGRPALTEPGVGAVSNALYWKLVALSVAIGAVGYADDRVSLRPKVKLLGQVAVAVLAWWWAGLGFQKLWPAIPAWLDFLLTTCWIVGAINSFNLIDGLDGLASGLAFIATVGMAGTLFLTDSPQSALFYFAFAGGLLGFLRYNFNPASVFLGDCGSMYIGFTVSALPLVSQTTDSFMVSVGVPFLAMGVPIFDTFLAIVRRLLRRLIAGGGANGEVMTADADHLHHRLLRSMGRNQRKVAWAMYAFAAFLVATGLVDVTLKSKAGGVWIAAVAVVAVIVFRDMAQIELFDAGRLLNSVAHNAALASRRRIARAAVPFYVTFDVAALFGVFLFCSWILRTGIGRDALRVALPVRAFCTFVALFFFKTYVTVWSRAMLSNYVRLALACAFGTAASSALLYYSPYTFRHQAAFAVSFAACSFIALLAIRALRGVVRDVFYAIDSSRLAGTPGVSRVLVYGAGLRYRAFRRELVRSAAAGSRMIVGIIDDDILLRNRYIGGIRIMGTLGQAPEIIAATKADAVVIACETTDEWMRVIRKTLEPTGVRITHFRLVEDEISKGPA